MLNRAWNIYQPLVLNKDLDGDGVVEVVIAHGGQPSFRPEVKQTQILSGLRTTVGSKRTYLGVFE
jgi:hypothetical protein